jgi:hypothetical protein
MRSRITLEDELCGWKITGNGAEGVDESDILLVFDCLAVIMWNVKRPANTEEGNIAVLDKKLILVNLFLGL